MTTISVIAKTSPLAVFRNKNFTLLWTGQFVSTVGSSLTSLAASILIFRLTGSALSVGLMLMATAAPSLLVGLVAGVLVDRFDRKRIMIAADMIRAVLVLLIPVLVPIHIAWLYVIITLNSAVGQFFDPAHASVLPEVASDEELAAANSFIAISSFGSTAVGFAASGLIASQFPIEWAFYLDGLSFVLSALCIVFIQIKPLEVEGRTGLSTILRNIRTGTKFLLENSVLRSLLYISVPVLLSFGLWNSLLLPFAERALHATEFEYGLQEGLTSVGFVIGSLLMARLCDRIREGQWISIGYMGMALVAILYSQVSAVSLAIILVGISGFFNAPSAIARRVLIQRTVPREIRGRVNSAFFVSRDVVLLLGMAVAGLADVVDVRIMILGSAALLLVSGLLSLIMTGIGQPASEWKKTLQLLRAAPVVSALGEGAVATLADMDLLIGHLPVFANLSLEDRKQFIQGARVFQVSQGETIVRHGETADEVFFILSGKAVAGVAPASGEYRSLSIMGKGDFFGEIAALTGMPRTADVVAEEDIKLLQVPAENVHRLMTEPRLRYLFLSKLTDRLSRTHEADFPRLARLDQESLLELRAAPVKVDID
jgi:DHA3 family macrolide efflux protein-like MFS transporter